MTHDIIRGSNVASVPLGVEITLLVAEAVIPAQAKHSDAGYDLHSIESTILSAGSRGAVGTGIAVAIPEGYVGYIKPRSGLAVEHGIDVLAGVVDSGYRGEVKVVLLNTDHNRAYVVGVGDRIAQLVIQPVEKIRFLPVEKLSESERGHGGFGSTGVN